MDTKCYQSLADGHLAIVRAQLGWRRVHCLHIAKLARLRKVSWPRSMPYGLWAEVLKHVLGGVCIPVYIDILIIYSALKFDDLQSLYFFRREYWGWFYCNFSLSSSLFVDSKRWTLVVATPLVHFFLFSAGLAFPVRFCASCSSTSAFLMPGCPALQLGWYNITHRHTSAICRCNSMRSFCGFLGFAPKDSSSDKSSHFASDMTEIDRFCWLQ